MAITSLPEDQALDWLELSLPEEGSGIQNGELALKLIICGPSIEGREVQPYDGGMFYVKAAIPVSTWPKTPPSFEFTTRIYHPLVHWETQQLCKAVVPELWEGSGYMPTEASLAAMDPALRACEPLLSSFRLLRDLLAKVHQHENSTAVNNEAQELLKREGGKAFDETARKFTDSYARSE